MDAMTIDDNGNGDDNTGRRSEDNSSIGTAMDAMTIDDNGNGDDNTGRRSEDNYTPSDLPMDAGIDYGWM
ncbi:hypothetical protein FOMG_04195 [Fusarium oxysporum f. sp. melonis 26406]|uniref:Uncharacterized protein n=1 Tax=Fusarium oxysporum f. sp. melonis 26406 TaxID=1089452 RepID=X0AP42_FUSOX|nr:hypothetical protein FOMG_04195 [Fusarium oxysporum f. sp. melonis 26406]